MQHPAEATVRIVIVEDEDLYRDLLVTSLAYQPQIKVVGDFGAAESALEHAPALRPDVALIDIALGGAMNGIQLGLRLRERLPTVGICLLSNSLTPAILRSVPESQLTGWSYLHKKAVSNVEVLTRAIVGASRGLVVLDPEITANAGPQRTVDDLTPRQMDVLRLIAQGYSNEAIGAQLGLAEKTVANYINSIYQKLQIDAAAPDIQPRVKATLYYFRTVVDA